MLLAPWVVCVSICVIGSSVHQCIVGIALRLGVVRLWFNCLFLTWFRFFSFVSSIMGFLSRVFVVRKCAHCLATDISFVRAQ